MQQIVNLGRPDDFYQKLGARYTALTPADFDKSAREAIDPDKLVVVVVGDAAKIKPQLDKLGIPVETVQLPTAR
jgi:predicted Zn-dependent peptidase